MTGKLTPKQQRFVGEYLVDLNATQAAIRAGYSAKTAHSSGPRLLENVGVQAALTARRLELEKSTGVTQERVLMELAKVGFSDIRKAVRWRGLVTQTGEEDEHGVPIVRVHNEVELVSSDDIDDDTAAAISEVSQTKEGLKVKFASKLDALDKIGRHLGMFKPETAPPPGAGDVNVTINNVEVNLTQVRQELGDIFDAVARRPAVEPPSEH
jgi:phage terminase small subunit